MEMARTSEGITAAEVKTYQKFCADQNIVADESEAGLQNGETIGTYVAITWGVDFTPATLAVALDKLRDKIVFYSPAQAEYLKVANQEPERANQLANWLATQGKPGQLVNQGDEAFDNLRLLLITLRGYEITPSRIRDAEDRIANKPGRRLHYAQAPRRTEPVSPAARDDDGTPFLGRNLNEPEWVRRSRERSEREAAEAKSAGATASAQAAAIREAKRQAESLQGGTHAETEQLRKIFATSGTEIDWVQTLSSRLQMQKQFEKHRAGSRFIR
jgi:hypothetical protein